MKKNFKLVLALVLSIMMIMGSVAALAQTVDSGKGGSASITVANAAKGETYKVVKIFGATVTGTTNGPIAYTGDIPVGLEGIFEKNATTGAITVKAAAVDDNGDFTEDSLTTLTNWAKADGRTIEAQAEADGSTLVFSNLQYGYYVVTSTQGAAVTINETNPNVTIYDKNTKTIELTKSVDDDNVKIGQTVTYTVDFATVNYIGSGESAEKVDYYTIEDTLPDFLSNVTVTGITVGGTAIDTQQFDANKKIVIPWVDSDGKHLYANGAHVVITYTAVVTDSVNVTSAGNTNKVTLKPHTTSGDKGPYEDEETIYSYAFGLKKVDAKQNALAGATFQLPFYVKQVGTSNTYKYAGTTATTGAVNTVTTPADGEVYIIGIATDETHAQDTKDTVFEITETVAPDGYNKLSAAFEVTATPTYAETIHQYFDADGNLTDEEHKVTQLDISAVTPVAGFKTVVNHSGAQLPSTGGIGTTIFYIAGSVLVLAAAILLITKRRMSNND